MCMFVYSSHLLSSHFYFINKLLQLYFKFHILSNTIFNALAAKFEEELIQSATDKLLLGLSGVFLFGKG